jgi:DNA-binding response OmpR family regulator
MDKAKKVLVVEDDQSIRDGITDLLTLEGFQVEQSENGKMALEVCMDFQPDVVISDVMMPEMDGHEFLEKYKEQTDLPQVPFIFLTALSDKYDIRRGMTLGADDFLTKPFSHDELLEAINTQFRKHEMRKAQFQKLSGSKITDLEKERELVIKEMHHRVKHNLAIISAFFELGDTSLGEEYIDSIKNRIFALASVHEEAYSNDTLTLVDTNKLISNILAKLNHTVEIEIEHELDKVELDISKAIPFGLLIYELGSMLMKKGFEGVEKKKLILRSQRIGSKFRVNIIINAINHLDLESDSHENEMLLIQTFASQLKGEVHQEIIMDIGTKYSFEVKI